MDNIEMSGFGCSDIVTYGVNEDGTLILSHHPFFPTLRLRPNDTHASFRLGMPSVSLMADGDLLRETVDKVTIHSGLLRICSHYGAVSVIRTCYPDIFQRAAYEQISISHPAGDSIRMDTSVFGKIKEEMGPMGICIADMRYEAKVGDV